MKKRNLPVTHRRSNGNSPRERMEFPGLSAGIPKGISKFREEYTELAYHFMLLGATLDRLAEIFGVDRRTIDYWLHSHPEFKQAVNRGRDQADAEVATSLFGRAKGCSHQETHIAVYKDKETGNIEVVATPITKYYPPDTIACIFWLKNRQRALWRDVNRTEHTGPNGQPIQKTVRLDLSSLTDAELELAKKLGLHLTNDVADGISNGLSTDVDPKTTIN